LEHKKIIGSRPFVHRDICPDDVFELSVTSKSKNALSLDIMLTIKHHILVHVYLSGSILQ